MTDKITINGKTIEVKDLKIGLDLAKDGAEASTIMSLAKHDVGYFIKEIVGFKVSPIQEEILKQIAANPQELTLIPHRPIWPTGVFWRIQRLQRRQRNKRGRWLVRELRRRYRIKRFSMYGKLRSSFEKNEIKIFVDEMVG